jgi:cell division protease FtsH
MSGADLANLVNEAVLLAAHRDLEQIPQECFEEALARVQLGALRPLVMSQADQRVLAYHGRNRDNMYSFQCCLVSQ